MMLCFRCWNGGWTDDPAPDPGISWLIWLRLAAPLILQTASWWSRVPGGLRVSWPQSPGQWSGGEQEELRQLHLQSWQTPAQIQHCQQEEGRDILLKRPPWVQTKPVIQEQPTQLITIESDLTHDLEICFQWWTTSWLFPNRLFPTCYK